MELNKKDFQMEVAGKTLSFSVSRLAEQANSAVIAQYGDTVVLATAVMGDKEREIDYFPLSVDYEERFYAAGKILGSRFVRREGRPSHDAILSGRLIDRTLRPFFDQRLRRDVQIVLTILSYDEQNDPDFVALAAASAALATSDIPWNGPALGVKVLRTKDGQTIINPTNADLTDADRISFEAFVSGNENKINMIELGGNQALEGDVVESFAKAHEEIKKLVAFQKDIVSKIGKPKAQVLLAEPDSGLKAKIKEFLKDKLEKAIYVESKMGQDERLGELKSSLMEYLKQDVNFDLEENSGVVEAVWEEEMTKLIQGNVLEKELRVDGRKLDEIRDLYAQVGIFKRLHGSALFIRGGTQSLAVTTLAAPGAEQLIETMEATTKRRFMLHYNFPPFSTGEIGRLGATGRREIGHGALAEKAIRPMIPSQDEFPYTIRVVSEILASNGSSSMATTCASSMSLMDAGVPLKKPVAGIAMGIIIKDDNNYKILTDIIGKEDHYGGMDFKVAGTDSGINAIQLDLKVEGVTIPMVKDVLERAKYARLQILEVMGKAIAAPKPQVSNFAPVIMTLNINPEKIGEVIGPGGKIINAIIKDTGVQTIDIEESGKVFVASLNHEYAKAAIRIIESITKEYKVGDIVEGNIIKILEFGAILDLGGGKDGMIHVSELKNGFVKKVEDVVKIGDFVRAKVIRVENGKIGLSIKALGDEK